MTEKSIENPLSDVRNVRKVRHSLKRNEGYSDKSDKTDNLQHLIDISELTDLFPEATEKDLIEYVLYPENELDALEIGLQLNEDEDSAKDWRKKSFYNLVKRLKDEGRALDERKKGGRTLYSLSEARVEELKTEIAKARDRAFLKSQSQALRAREALEIRPKLSAEELVKACKDYCQKKEAEVLAAATKGWVVFSFRDFASYDPEIATLLLEDPENTLRAFAHALEMFDGGFVPSKNPVGFVDLPSSSHVQVRKLATKHINKMVVLEGNITSVVKRRPKVVTARFECPNCLISFNTIQVDTRLREPDRCGCGRKGRFKLLSKEMTDTIHFNIEEPPEVLEASQQARKARIVANGFLADDFHERRLNPGTRVRVVCVVKERPIYFQGGGQALEFDLLLLANSLEFPEDDEGDIELLPEDIKSFEEFAVRAKKDCAGELKKAGNSLNPHIVGQEHFKQGITLQMHASPNTHTAEGSLTRNIFHILAAGDPSTGKSQIGVSAAKIMPRARWTGAEGTSGVGLTASVVRDDLSNEWSVQGGVLVMANGSLAVLDELDKVEDDVLYKLHTVLEHCEVTIDKANVHAKLPAHTRVLALLNPKKSRFDNYEDLANQIPNMSSFLNRFDLIVILRDNNTERDAEIFDMIARRRSNSEVQGFYSQDFLKKKLVYVNKHSSSQLEISDKALNYLQETYVKLRGEGDFVNGKIPLNPRIADSWLRLSLAVANFRHAWVTDKLVSLNDAKLAFKIWRRTTGKVITADDGRYDIDRTEKTSHSARKTYRELKAYINEQDAGEGVDEELIVQEFGSKIETTLERLGKAGDIYTVRPGVWKVLK